jgi:hypothetical protein
MHSKESIPAAIMVQEEAFKSSLELQARAR